MFAESLLETSWDKRARRGWMTLTSFGLQAVVIAVVLMISLLHTVGMPLARTVSTPISMGRRDPGPAPRVQGHRSGGMQIVAYSGPLREPTSITHGIPSNGDAASQPFDCCGPIGVGVLPSGPALPLPISGTNPPLPVAPIAKKPTFRPSSLLEGMLIHRVQPVYPPMARSARIQGPVELEAMISKEGKIDRLQLLSGHPLLVKAAIDAVSQWRYRPYVLNGEAIEVETRITVNFVLAAN
jgi:periplasmic protein TonB